MDVDALKELGIIHCTYYFVCHVRRPLIFYFRAGVSLVTLHDEIKSVRV